MIVNIKKYKDEHEDTLYKALLAYYQRLAKIINKNPMLFLNKQADIALSDENAKEILNAIPRPTTVGYISVLEETNQIDGFMIASIKDGSANISLLYIAEEYSQTMENDNTIKTRKNKSRELTDDGKLVLFNLSSELYGDLKGKGITKVNYTYDLGDPHHMAMLELLVPDFDPGKYWDERFGECEKTIQ